MVLKGDNKIYDLILRTLNFKRLQVGVLNCIKTVSYNQIESNAFDTVKTLFQGFLMLKKGIFGIF